MFHGGVGTEGKRQPCFHKRCHRFFIFILIASTDQHIDVDRDVVQTDSKAKSPRKKPVPDFNRLKVEQAMNEEKVVEFFKASFKLPTSIEIVEKGGDGQAKSEGRKGKITLPPTDRLSQLTIRLARISF